MNSYINPEIYVPADLVGVDEKIELLRQKLTALAWLEYPFPRAIIQVERKENTDTTRGRGGDIFFPEVTQRNRESLVLMPNDNWPSYSFFYLRDSASFPDYIPGPGDPGVIVSQPASLVVWANLKRLDNTKDYRWSEVLKTDLLGVLKNDYNFNLVSMHESYSRVFQDFTLNEQYRKYLKPPFWAIRIDFTIAYNQFNPC